ncbi:MAG TPA: PAS domain S-box protein, partial [Nitrospira sp.]|nr:PAS domain S-box protein [Nitrospira sp.]
MSEVQATIINVNERNGQRYERRNMLERAGYRVLDANCGADALRLLQDVHPELVLLDIDLPDISGFDLCRQIKNRPELTDTMVLHVSAAEVSGSDRALGLEMGSDGYLVEPVEEQELLAGVRSLLRLRARQRENEGLLARLRRSEEQFRGLFEQAAVGMCVLGPDGRFLRVNNRLGVIAGRTEQELMERELRDLTHPADREEHDSQVGMLLLGGLTEVSLDQRLLRPDGRTIWTTLTLSIQWDAGGRIQSLIGVVEDIDARKRAELELRIHAVRQQLLSEAMDRLLRVDDPAQVMHEIFASLRSTLELDMFLDYDVRAELDAIELSTWAGIPEQTLAPLQFLKFGQALCGTSAESRRPIVIGHLQSVSDPKALRIQATGSDAYVCFPLIVGDRLLGTLAFASRRRSSFEPDDLDLLEAVSHSVAMAKERRRLLQEARQRAAQLAESEERLRFATEGAGMGTWDVDLRTGRLVWDRQNARLLGYASDGCTASARQWWNLVEKEDRPAVREAVSAARHSRGFYRCEHRIRRADTGETRWLAS